MTRRALTWLALVAVVFAASGAQAGVVTKTWTINQDTVGHAETLQPPLQSSRVNKWLINIEWKQGADTATNDDHTWIIQTRVDDEVDRWRTIYQSATVTADSTASYPMSIWLDRGAYEYFDDIRILFVSDNLGNGNTGDTTYSGNAVDLVVHAIGFQDDVPWTDHMTAEWAVSHLKRSDSAQTSWVYVAPYSEFWVFIDEVVGDTLVVDSLRWRVDTKSAVQVGDTPSLTVYADAVVDADSSAYPVFFYWDGKDSLTFDYLRIAQEACLTCDTSWTNSGAAADSGFATYRVRIVGKKR